MTSRTSRAYVLLSGGIDSTTCLYLARKQFGVVIGLSVFYGQRHRKEIEHARASCAKVGARHAVLDISASMPRSALTDADADIPRVSYAEIEGVSPAYVPFRNGFLLALAAAYIIGEREALKQTSGQDPSGEWGLYFGAHAEDAQNWAYADCTPEFIGAMANAIFVGTYRQLRLHAPLEWLDKRAIIELGGKLGVNWSLTWSCYLGGDAHCGTCPTCRARREGFSAAGVPDPTVYAQAAA